MRCFSTKVDNFFFGHLQNQYARMLEKACEGCKSLLDVGCGENSPVRSFSRKFTCSVGIDGFQPSIDKSRAKGIHHEYVLMNVMDLDKRFPADSFDCVIASDLVEHLKKEDGYRLINMMEKIAADRVIIFTPNGFLEQQECDGNPHQVHLCGWDADEMRKVGYKVTGINGWRPLRGEFARIRWRPKVFWGRISLLTQYFTTKNPKHAFAILCVKEMKRGSSIQAGGEHAPG
jgi:hypothetical protein